MYDCVWPAVQVAAATFIFYHMPGSRVGKLNILDRTKLMSRQNGMHAQQDAQFFLIIVCDEMLCHFCARFASTLEMLPCVTVQCGVPGVCTMT